GVAKHEPLLRYPGVDPEERDVRQQGGFRQTRQADAGNFAEGGRRGRGAWLAEIAGAHQVVHRAARSAWHAGAVAEPGIEARTATDRAAAHGRMAIEGRRRRACGG